MPTHDHLTPLQVRRALRINTAAGALGTVWIALAFSLPLTMFLEKLGATGPQMGLSVTLQQLATAIQIPAALWVERLSRRKPFWAIMAIPHRLIWLLPVALILIPGIPPTVVIWSTLAMVGVSSVLAHATIPPWFSWMADLVPPEIGGRFWGTRQSITTAVMVLAMFAGGWILDHVSGASGMLGFALTFALGSAFGTVDIFLHLAVPEPTPHRNPSAIPLRRRFAAPWANPDLRWLTLSIGVWAFSNGLHASFSPVYLKREFDIPYGMLMALPIAGAISAVLTGIPIGKLIDRYGARLMGILLMIIGPAFSAIWFFLPPGTVTLLGIDFPRPIAILLINHVLAGGMYAGIGLCHIHLLNTITGRQGRTLAMAMHWSAMGAMAALGPLCGGWFMDLWTQRNWSFPLAAGAKFTFFQAIILAHILLVWFLAVPLLARVRTRTGEIPLRMILAGLRTLNPFRPLFPVGSGYLDTRETDANDRSDGRNGS